MRSKQPGQKMIRLECWTRRFGELVLSADDSSACGNEMTRSSLDAPAQTQARFNCRSARRSLCRSNSDAGLSYVSSDAVDSHQPSRQLKYEGATTINRCWECLALYSTLVEDQAWGLGDFGFGALGDMLGDVGGFSRIFEDLPWAARLAHL